jgi:hypothetical protein
MRMFLRSTVVFLRLRSGGLHVAPNLGRATSIDLLYQSQWMKTFNGYVVDAIEPFAFVVLATMVMRLIAGRTTESHRWLVVALVLLALLRVNQVLFYWTSFYSLRCYYIAVTVILRPLVLAAWVLAWRDWFQLDRRRWLPDAVAVFTALYLVAALASRPGFMPGAGHGVRAAAEFGVQLARLAFAALYLWIVGSGVMRAKTVASWFAALAAVLVGVGLFATELNALGLPGIWFPYGVGVARGHYAYAAFIPLLFALVLARSSGGRSSR